MAEPKTYLVVNPKSAGGRTGKAFPEIAAAVRSAIGEFDHAFTARIGDGISLTREALRKGYDRVVAVGGDGTANEVVNGFYEGDVRLGKDASFALIPRGTGGDLRKAFGWTNELKQACERLKRNQAMPMDLGKVSFVGHDGKPQHRYFVNVASAGDSGVVDDEVNKASKALGGTISFQLASLRALLKYSDKPILLTLDDQPPESLRVTCLAVGNGQYFGSGMWVCPAARMDDGIFDITVWSGFGLKDFALNKGRIYDGSHVTMKGAKTYKAKRVHAHSDHEVLLDIDGEQPGRLPATWEMLQGVLKICC